jgi:adenosylcobinamide kinase / adenosylcobinamide-phosphate guanylyltransferase
MSVSPETQRPKKEITLVLGGAQSGKSHYAQQLASHFERVTFIATARRTDAEMRKKIARHRRARPVSWKTIEAPVDLDKAIRSQSQNADLILIDCLTVYMDNVAGTGKKRKRHAKDCIEESCDAIRACRPSVIVVSNEVGSGIVPEYRSGRIYRDFLGQMNQKLAQIADRVVLMIAGLPVTIKGSNAIQSKSATSDARRDAGASRAPANGARKSQFRSQEMLK